MKEPKCNIGFVFFIFLLIFFGASISTFYGFLIVEESIKKALIPTLFFSIMYFITILIILKKIYNQYTIEFKEYKKILKGKKEKGKSLLPILNNVNIKVKEPLSKKEKENNVDFIDGLDKIEKISLDDFDELG